MFEIGAKCGSGFEAASQEALKPCGSDPSSWAIDAKICGLWEARGSHRWNLGRYFPTWACGAFRLLCCDIIIKRFPLNVGVQSMKSGKGDIN